MSAAARPRLRPWRFLPALGMAALIFWLSHQPRLPPPPVVFDGVDKILHAGAYGLLCLLLLWAAQPTALGAALACAALAALYGLSDELHQSFVPGRQADPLDAVADTMGALLVAGFWARRTVALRARPPSGSG